MRKTAIMSILFIFSFGLLMADFPGVKFVAPMEGLYGTVEGPWTLTIMATSSQTIDLIVDEATEIEDEQDNALTPDGLAAMPEGTIVKIAAVFMEEGLYARGVDIVKHNDDFELTGQVDSVDCVSGVVVLLGFEISLSTDTIISGADGDLLTCENITPEQFIKVEGFVTDSALTATKVKVGIPGKEHLVVEFDAVVSEMTDSEWLVAIGGNNPGATVPVLVVLDESTEIIGTVEVGSEVEITGVLTPELAVLARMIKVEGLKRSDKGDSGKKGDDEGAAGDDESGDENAEDGGKKDDDPGKNDDNNGKKGNPPGKDKSDKTDDDAPDEEEN
jgi:Domain of unknown function (DUF5666)